MKPKEMKRLDGKWLLILCLTTAQAGAQVGQLNINRVEQMPNLPSPYIMRNWKEVAVKYDEFVFSTASVGQYLPLIHLKPNGINYSSLQPILLDTYVGSASSGSQAEAINIIPAIVGATLNGIDKSNQNGINWVIKTKDFFNLANGQNVYLNAYSTPSGSDWWYDLMPNVYFYQLYSQYPSQEDFNQQFTMVANRWLEAVYAMGGSTTPWATPQMNYRAWDLMTMTGNAVGVKEPESAGTIAWLLYQAYAQTGEKKYLYGAQMAMKFLSNLSSNPSYELQLPYGTFMAAKMNAELGTDYDVEKMINWSFDKGPLRNWGAIVGTWNGSDVSGLIGEANDAGNDYAFVMNGFQQAAAFVPLVKYDKRFARAIAKWALNLANASRFFYSTYLPSTSQDNFSWSSLNDPQSVIAYEALKENLSGKALYATGDAMNGGWAQTNLSIYSSSSVGYMAALLEPTDVDGILLWDVNKTDFFGQNTFPSFLVYNPYAVDKMITLPLGSSSYDIYDALSETKIKSGVTGNTIINAKADQAMLLVYLPSGSTPFIEDGKLYVGTDVADYHYGYQFGGKLRIRSLAVQDTLVEFNQPVSLYASIENATETVTYNWYVNKILVSSLENFVWVAPQVEGTYTLLLEISSGLTSAKDSLYMTVVDRIPVPPVAMGFTTDKTWYAAGDEAVIICNASNTQGGPLVYTWSLPGGTLISQNDSLIHWTVPSTEGVFEISCEVANNDDLKTSISKEILVKSSATEITPPIGYYPLDGNALDFSGNDRHATQQGVQLTADEQGEPDHAYQFTLGSDIIYVPNESALNFREQITISFWVKVDEVTQESFIISHGSWEERWKVSITPDKKLRWTVKTTSGTKDLDSSFPLMLNHFYHFTVVYSGYSMELYTDGELDTFSSNSGLMSTTNKAITFGRKDQTTTNYSLKGVLDEIRIYDKALEPAEIMTLKSIWNAVTGIPVESNNSIKIYPNPTNGVIHIEGSSFIRNPELSDVTGRRIDIQNVYSTGGNNLTLELSSFTKGLIILRIEAGESVIHHRIIVE
jgi:hypothetical protein